LSTLGIFTITAFGTLRKVKTRGIDLYLPNKNYRKRHPGLGVKLSSLKSRRRKFMPEDFTYDEKKRVTISVLQERS